MSGDRTAFEFKAIGLNQRGSPSSQIDGERVRHVRVSGSTSADVPKRTAAAAPSGSRTSAPTRQGPHSRCPVLPNSVDFVTKFQTNSRQATSDGYSHARAEHLRNTAGHWSERGDGERSRHLGSFVVEGLTGHQCHRALEEGTARVTSGLRRLRPVTLRRHRARHPGAWRSCRLRQFMKRLRCDVVSTIFAGVWCFKPTIVRAERVSCPVPRRASAPVPARKHQMPAEPWSCRRGCSKGSTTYGQARPWP